MVADSEGTARALGVAARTTALAQTRGTRVTYVTYVTCVTCVTYVTCPDAVLSATRHLSPRAPCRCAHFAPSARLPDSYVGYKGYAGNAGYKVTPVTLVTPLTSPRQVTSMSEVHQELQALRARNFSNIFTTSFLD